MFFKKKTVDVILPLLFNKGDIVFTSGIDAVIVKRPNYMREKWYWKHINKLTFGLLFKVRHHYTLKPL